MTIAPFGASMLSMRPAATGLRTKRTQCAAGRSAVKRPWPVTSAGSSSRRIGAADPGHAGAFGAVRAHAAACSSARRTTARTRSRRYSRIRLDDPPADRPRRRRPRPRRGRRASPGAWPLSAASASAIRRGRASAPPTPTRGSAILPPCKPIGDQRRRDGEIAGAAVEFVEAEFGVGRRAAAAAPRPAIRPRPAPSS